MTSHTIPLLPYPWSIGWGEDRYGIWAEFQIRRVTQRMRWIEPGTFCMGSPESEPKRFDDEIQHEVELTQGFWLADTTCTQGLWQAVMGNNPSEFKGAKRPVENISFEDCQKFIKKANDRVSNLDLRFPTEAEWEYACRAGTQTPFWFGKTINMQQVNYGGGFIFLSSQETVDVRALPCNDWGLYQMHGNVREWCADWYGAYEAEMVNDPQGSPAGNTRVLRGGSWFSRARGCRSAARLSRPANVREDNYGFRLSCAQ